MQNLKENSTQNKDYIANAFFQYLRHWKVFAIVVFLFAVLAVVYVKLSPKVYSMNASVMIKKEDQKTSSMMASAMMKSFGMGNMGSLIASGSTDDEIQVFYSQNIIRKALSALGMYVTYDLERFPVNKSLYKDTPLLLGVNSAFVDTLTMSFKFDVDVKESGVEVSVKAGKHYKETFEYASLPADIKTKFGTFRLKENDSVQVKMKRPYSLEINLAGLDAVAEKIKDKDLGIETLTKKSDVIGLTYEDEIRQRGKDFLNEIIRQYNIDALSDKNKTALATTQFLQIRIDSLYNELRAVEGNIELYKESNNFIDAETEISLTLGKISQLQEKNSSMDVQLAMINAIENQIKNRGSEYSLLPSSLGLPGSVASAVQDYNDAILYRMRILRNSTEENPAVQTIDEQLKSLNKTLLVSLQNAKRDIGFSKADAKQLESEINSRVSQMPRLEKDYVDLVRQQELKSKIYVFLLQKMEETQLTLASTEPKAKIVDDAYCLTDPVAPKKFIVLFAALLLGFLISAVIVCLRIFRKKEVESLRELQTLSDCDVLECFTPKSDTDFLLKKLRTSILQKVMFESDNKVVVVSSLEKDEVENPFAKQLAESLAQANCKTIALDFNISNPNLSRLLKLADLDGVSDYLLKQASDENIIQSSPTFAKLDIIPAGKQTEASEMLTGKRVDKLFKMLKEKYDVVIVETPSFRQLPDSLLLMNLSDYNLLTAEIGSLSKDSVSELNNLLAENRIKEAHLVAFDSQKQK